MYNNARLKCVHRMNVLIIPYFFQSASAAAAAQPAPANGRAPAEPEVVPVPQPTPPTAADARYEEEEDITPAIEEPRRPKNARPARGVGGSASISATSSGGSLEKVSRGNISVVVECI